MILSTAKFIKSKIPKKQVAVQFIVTILKIGNILMKPLHATKMVVSINQPYADLARVVASFVTTLAKKSMITKRYIFLAQRPLRSATTV